MSAVRIAALAAAVLLSAAGVATTQAAFFVAALPLAAWASLGFFAGTPVLDLDVHREVSEQFATAGSVVEIAVSLRNRGKRLESLGVRDVPPRGLSLLDGSVQWRGSLEKGAVAEIRYRARVARGFIRFETVSLRAEDPFSALVTRAELPCPARIIVPPTPLVCGAIALQASAVRPFAGDSRARRRGGGSDFAGTREYAPGDPLRSLNWRAEALWGASVVNVFEEDRALDVGLILDARAEAYERIELFESAVAAAASLGDSLLAGGNRVAFLNYGSVVEWTPPGAGRAQRVALRVAAARASLGDHAAFERFDNLPIRLFPPRSSVVLVSPLLRGDLVALRSIRALGYSVTVLRPSLRPRPRPEGSGPMTSQAASLARRLLDIESRVLGGRLRGAGIEVIDWDIERPLARSIELAGARR